MKLFSNYNNKEDSEEIQEIVAMCEGIVLKYIGRKVIPHREKEDVVMAVMEKFLDQRSKIDSNFQGKSKVSTYYVAVLNRMCCEIIRKEQKHWFSIQEKDADTFSFWNEQTKSYDTEKAFIIKEEMIRLTIILKMFVDEYPKLVVFLKQYFNIPIKNGDIELFEKTHQPALRNILTGLHSESKGEAFENMAKILHIVENKKVGADAVRMWLNKKTDAILNRMNINGLYQYNKETLGILLEMISKQDG